MGPDLRAVLDEAAGPGRPLDLDDVRRRARRARLSRVVAVGAALAVVATLAVTTPFRVAPARVELVAPPSAPALPTIAATVVPTIVPTPEVTPSAVAPTSPAPAVGDDGWTTIPGSALPSRYGGEVFWHDGRVLWWGGRVDDGEARDGAAYDPVTDRWEPLPEGPVDLTTSVWTGDALYSVDLEAGAAAVWQGDTWTALPAPPLPPRASPVAGWAGDRLVVFGGVDIAHGYPQQALRDGAVYDPGAGTWSPIATAPQGRVGGATVWTGAELLVWGGYNSGAGSEGDSGDRPGVRVGLAYDPAADRWRLLAGAPVHSGEQDIAWTGRELLAVGRDRYTPNELHPIPPGAAYDPATDTWRTLPELPVGSPPWYLGPAVAWTGHELLVVAPEPPSLAAYRPDADRWVTLDTPPAEEHFGMFEAAWSGDVLAVLVESSGAGLLYRPDPHATPSPRPSLPAAGICDEQDGLAATVVMLPDTPGPRCLRVTAEQHLVVVNRTGRAISVRFGPFGAEIPDGSAAQYPVPFGQYLTPGVHQVATSAYAGDAGPEIWFE